MTLAFWRQGEHLSESEGCKITLTGAGAKVILVRCDGTGIGMEIREEAKPDW